MSTLHLDWVTLCPSRDRRHNVKGTELEMAVCGPFSRYAVVAVRDIEFVYSPGHGHYTLPAVRYVVRDADAVTDHQLKNGERPPIVFHAHTLDEVEDWVLENT